jgi:hypothetical protein
MLPFSKESRQVHRNRKRIELNRIRSQEKFEYQIYLKIKNLLKNVLSEEYLHEIAIKTGIQQRQRELTPIALVGVLMLGCSNSSKDIPIAALDTMCMYLRKLFNIHIKKQSLQNKINSQETAKFIKEVMGKIMSYEIDKVLHKLLKKKKRKHMYMFARILIQDSTTISLPETLARIFKGCGGSASKAAVKLDFIIDQANHLIVKMRLVAGKVPDSALSGDIIENVEEGDLIIRDLGYFNLANFSKIVSKKAYFISRLMKGVNVYLNKSDEQPINLVEHLEKLGVKKKNIDIDVYIGKNERLSVRLIGVKVPSEVIESRRRQYKKARGRSQEPSESLQEWHGYTLMTTNIPRHQISLESILKLYRVRWQIELFFKNMKSILLVDEMTGENKNRILCLIFTKLAITWIASILYAYAQTKVEEGREISRFKFTRWLKDMGDLKKAVCLRDFTDLLGELERDLDLLCKEKRKKREKNIEEIFQYENAA